MRFAHPCGKLCGKVVETMGTTPCGAVYIKTTTSCVRIIEYPQELDLSSPNLTFSKSVPPALTSVGAGVPDGPHGRLDPPARGVEDAAPYEENMSNRPLAERGKIGYNSQKAEKSQGPMPSRQKAWLVLPSIALQHVPREPTGLPALNAHASALVRRPKSAGRADVGIGPYGVIS